MKPKREREGKFALDAGGEVERGEVTGGRHGGRATQGCSGKELLGYLYLGIPRRRHVFRGPWLYMYGLPKRSLSLSLSHSLFLCTCVCV